MTRTKMTGQDRVAQLFKDRIIFLSGGSGFMGKIFIEKLLRVTEIKKVFLLFREGKGIEPEKRLENLLNDAIFDKLKRQMKLEQIKSKLEVVSGDCEKLNLGLSLKDRLKITENATIFYHFAATTRFDEKMKTAVDINVRGTREMIKLAFECNNLEMFGHMSTCFCHVHEEILHEMPYKPPINPHDMIHIVNTMSNKELENYSEILLNQFKIPNSYAFTKSLAEALVVDAKINKNLPAIIFRPSIVVSTWQDPFPGYIDNTNGITGFMLATGKGISRSLFIDGNNFADLIPCDISINGVFVGTWNYLKFNEPESFVMHLVLPQEFRLTWQEIRNIVLKLLKKFPFNQILWYPNCRLTRFKWLHMIRFYAYQYIPAIIIDFFVGIFGHEKFIAKVNKNVEKGNEAVAFFANTSWHFKNSVSTTICSRLNNYEKKVYGTQLEKIFFEEFYENALLGIRRFILKTGDNKIAAARREMNIKNIIDKVVKLFFYFGLSFCLQKMILMQISDSNRFIAFLNILFYSFVMVVNLIL